MKITIRKNRNHCKLLAVVMAAFVVTALPSITLADNWELRTVDKEVPGTLEIESGEVLRGIQISKYHLTRIRGPKKVAVLTNLCIGYILADDFDKARSFCDQATEGGVEENVTYNNRGVLNALSGDYAAAREDFFIAADVECDFPCNVASNAGEDQPHHVARRNLSLADAKIVAHEPSKAADQYTASKSQ